MRYGLGAEQVTSTITFGGQAPPPDPTLCINGYDPYGQACQDWTPITSDPNATSAALRYLYGSQPSGITQFLAKNSNVIIIVGIGLLALMVLGPRR